MATPLFTKTNKDPEINWGSSRRCAPPRGCDNHHHHQLLLFLHRPSYTTTTVVSSSNSTLSHQSLTRTLANHRFPSNLNTRSQLLNFIIIILWLYPKPFPFLTHTSREALKVHRSTSPHDTIEGATLTLAQKEAM